MPAFETTTSTGPSSCSTTEKAASTDAPSVTSQGVVRNPSTAPCRDVTATRSPAARKASAMARPIPRLPPVTSTTRPASSPISDAHGVVAAVDVHDLAGRGGEKVGEQRHARLGDRNRITDVPAEGGPFVPHVLKAGEPGDGLGGQ